MAKKKNSSKSQAYVLISLLLAVLIGTGYIFMGNSGASRFDTNKNKGLEMSEFQNGMAALFDLIDKDRDGKIYKSEATSFIEKDGRNIEKSVAMFLQFKNFDADHNRHISRKEATASAHMQAMFEMLDKNYDQKIDHSEMGKRLLGKFMFK